MQWSIKYFCIPSAMKHILNSSHGWWVIAFYLFHFLYPLSLHFWNRVDTPRPTQYIPYSFGLAYHIGRHCTPSYADRNPQRMTTGLAVEILKTAVHPWKNFAFSTKSVDCRRWLKCMETMVAHFLYGKCNLWKFRVTYADYFYLDPKSYCENLSKIRQL